MIFKLVFNIIFIFILEKFGQQGGEAGGFDELVFFLLDLRVGKILDVKKVKKNCKLILIRVRKKKMWKRFGREISRCKLFYFEVYREMKSSRIIVGLQEYERFVGSYLLCIVYVNYLYF